MQFRFENHLLDEERRELMRDSEPVPLEPQVFDLLVYLVRNRDRVVTKGDDRIDLERADRFGIDDNKSNQCRARGIG